MRICYDATSLYRKKTGIEGYTLNLLKSIMELDKKNFYIIFFRNEILNIPVFKKANTKLCCIPHSSQLCCEQILLPLNLSRINYDVVHFPAFPPGVLRPKKFIMTIHDATMWKYNSMLSWKNKIYMKPLTNVAIKHAQKIITVSDSSKSDIEKYCNISSSKVVNTWESFGENFRIIKDRDFLEQIRIKYQLSFNFILSVGTLEPRKNLIILLEAFSRLKKQQPYYNSLKLVLTGRNGWGREAIYQRIIDLKLDKEVLFTGYVDETDLVGLYNLANIFVFPSIYEGFGLPPLEAMACGCPVIASNTSSMPEVLGDAAVLIDPFDVEKLADKIRDVLENKNLRDEMSKKGLERVKQFSWQQVAKKTIEVYDSIQ